MRNLTELKYSIEHDYRHKYAHECSAAQITKKDRLKKKMKRTKNTKF